MAAGEIAEAVFLAVAAVAVAVVTGSQSENSRLCSDHELCEAVRCISFKLTECVLDLTERKIIGLNDGEELKVTYNLPKSSPSCNSRHETSPFTEPMVKETPEV